MDLFRLDGRAALVTGGNGGIGLGIARALVEAGASVVVAGRDRDKGREAEALLNGIRPGAALSVTADLRQEASARALVEAATGAFGRLDILVNNAGINIRKRPEAYSLTEWQSVLDTNLTAAFLCCQAAYPAMKAAGGGKIVNVGSMMSIFGGALLAPYGASKGGIVQLTRSLAVAWAPDNIQVNAILPGWIDTELTRQARIDVPGLEERVVQRTPAGRWGTADELGGTAVFLASAASGFVTGAAIPVDGGYSALG